MRDAAGNIPKNLTAYEQKFRNTLQNGEFKKRFDELQERRKLPLKDKIALSEERIREWAEAFGGNVAVSFSGGKDSTVLLFLVRRLYPDTEAVFCNTGLEYPEVLSMVRRTPNISVIRPKTPFHKVIETFGYPVISKTVARGIEVLKNPTGFNQNICRLYRDGINRFGEPVNGFKVSDRWKFLIDAPFRISDRCCGIMKKEPIHRYEKQTGKVMFVGMMAADSKRREKSYLQTGCNAFDMKHPRSMPMAFWTDQDVLQFLKMFNIPYASVYGNIIQDRRTGRLMFSGVQSTGCIFCGFGLHMESAPNRFHLLRTTHRKLYEYCMNILGLRDILNYIASHTEGAVSRKFSIDNGQGKLF